MINRLKSIIFTVCMLGACTANAVDDGAALNLSEDDYIGEVPKVLTVSRLAQSKQDSPSAVTVIDRENHPCNWPCGYSRAIPPRARLLCRQKCRLYL